MYPLSAVSSAHILLYPPGFQKILESSAANTGPMFLLPNRVFLSLNPCSSPLYAAMFFKIWVRWDQYHFPHISPKPGVSLVEQPAEMATRFVYLPVLTGFPVFHWGHAVFFHEGPGEIGMVVKTTV